MRETWTYRLGWDESVPDLLCKKWVEFFSYLADVSELEYDRCLKPENALGNPTLVVFWDGSDLAYGIAVFIRWKLISGLYGSRLMFAKNRIAPWKRISTPQMDLNGAVLAKCAKNVAESDMRYNFNQVIYLTDSEIVLAMLNKQSTRFRIYEADWLIRPKTPQEISATSVWYQGPTFLSQPMDQWPIKSY